MANSVRLIDYTQPQGDFITFFTELDSDLKVGEKIFIIGGNYDNTKYTDKTHPEFDPFNEFANGYEVIAVDSTTNSNAVTLNIRFRVSAFNQAGVETSVFNPLPVYKTEEELLINPNQTRESYISKSYFKRGEFNGGTFDDGIFGEYNIKGVESTSGVENNIRPLRPYERQHFVNNLIAEYRANGMDSEADALANYNYSELELPVLNNLALFNNDFENIQAEWKNGVFLGGDFQWGNWKSKYGSDKTGLLQTLNVLGGAEDLLDTSKFNISEFNNNNNGFGYSLMTSGNVGKIYRSTEKHAINIIASTRTIQIDYFPYPLWKSLENDRFDTSIRIFSKDNDKVFDIESIKASTAGLLDTNDIILSETQTYTTLGSTDSTSFVIDQLLFDEIGNFDIEIYVKDNTSKNRNTIDTARIYNADIFGGIIDNTYMQGGDMHWGEFRKGRIASNYGRMHWNNGVFNGLKDESFAEDLRWNDGKFIDGNWKGDINISIRNFEISESFLTINIPKRYKHLLQIGNDVFISYFKKSVGNSYFDNFTDKPDTNLVNFREFKLRNIVENEDLDNELQVQLVLEGKVDDINEDVNLQFAKISESYFTKGFWNDGIWESGLRKVENNVVNDFRFFQSAGTNFLEFDLDIERANLLNKGELMDVSNLQAIREINIGIIDGVPSIDNVPNDDRKTQFVEPFNSILTVLDVSTSGTVLTTFKDLDTIDSDEEITWDLGGDLIDITEILGSTSGISLVNKNTQLTNTLWLDGQFKSGAWQGGIWRNGTLSSELYFDNENTGIQSVFQSGYWKDGTWNKGALLSGIWENGIYNDGVITNLFNNEDNNDTKLWDKGDTVFIDGIINNVEWRRGLMLSSQFNGGKIINGGIENVDFKGGQYTNGLGEFNNDLNSNRSGRLLSDGTYVDLSAPSLIYIDGNGWVQLDQNSFYQKDYNVIIQDLDKYENPFNNEMFNVLDRNKYGSRLKLDYSTAGDNPLYLLEEFSNMKPLLAIDNIDGIAQISDTKYWIGDSNHKRILEIDTVTNEVDVLGLVLGDETKDIYNFNQVKFLECSSLLETTGINQQQVLYGYIVDADENGNDTVKSISVDKQTITNINIDLDTLNGEEIIDITVTPLNNSLNAETVIVLTNKNNIFYAFNNWSEFKSVTIPTTIQNVTKLSAIRKATSNTIDLILYNTTLSHLILDFNFTVQEYQIRATSPITINDISTAIGSGTVTSFDIKYISNTIGIWIVLDNNNIIKFEYQEPFNGATNLFKALNETDLEFPISGINLNYDSSELNVIGLNGNDSLFLATANLDKIVTGFGNVIAPIKFLDRNILSVNDTAYWYYDDETARLIHVNEGLADKYDVNTDVDTVGASKDVTEIIKIVGGDSNNRIFSIQRNKVNGEYTVRKSEFGKSDSNNQTIFTIDNQDKIHDIVYNNKLFILSNDTTVTPNVPVITSIDNQTITNYDLTTMNYYNSSPIFGTDGDNFIFDIIKEDNKFLCLITSDEGYLYELVMDNTTVLSSREIYSGLPTVNDIVLKYEGEFRSTPEKHYSAYLSTDNGIIKIFSDKALGNLTFRWANESSDLYYDGFGVSNLTKNDSSENIIAKIGQSFFVVDGKYVSEDYILDSSVLSPTNDIFGLSASRLVQMSNSSGEVLSTTLGFNVGQYNQNSRVGEFGTTPSNDDLLLNNPKSIIHAPAFFGGVGNDYVFFIDSTTDANVSTIRYLNLNSSNRTYEIITDGGSNNYKDLSYDHVNNVIYYMEIVSGNTVFGYIDSTFTKNAETTVSGVEYEKFSYNDLGGTKVFACLSANSRVDIVANTLTPTPSQVSSGVGKNYTDISLLEQLSQFIIFVQTEDTIETLTNISTPVTTGGNWGGAESVNINDIVNINERKVGGIEELSVYNKEKSDIVTFNIDPTQISEDSVSLSDFGFDTFSSGNEIFVYNNPSLDTNGIVKLNYNGTTPLGVNRGNQLDDLVQTDTFITMTVIDDNNVYALFDDGANNKLYHYDFTVGVESVTEITTSPIAHRDVSEATPPLSFYDYKIVDLSTYNNGSLTSLVVLFEIIDTITPFSPTPYDVALYIPTSNTYSKINELYGQPNNEPNTVGLDAITTTGDIEVTRLGDGGSNNGGIRYLFNSQVEPRLDVGFNSEYIYFYFGDTGSANFLKILTEDLTITTLTNNEIEDLEVEIAIPGFNKNASIEVATDVIVYPNPNTGTGFLSASAIVGGTANNQVKATFTNISGFDTTETYSFRVKTTLDSGQITTLSGAIDGNDIVDFRVYDNTANKIIIRKVIGDNPINSIDNVSDYYQLSISPNTGYSLGSWNIQDSTPTSLLELRAPIQPTPTGTAGIYENVLDNNQVDYILQPLDALDNNYELNVINKGYKVDSVNNSNSTLSPHLTGRVLLNTLVQENVLFNNLGTTKTAHLVSSTWDSGLFLGTWDAPFYFDNKIIEDFSIFINGTFEGDFYDGFFLGGTFQNSTTESNLFQGHFSSDDSNINFLSGNLNSNYRYDILNAKFDSNNDKVIFTVEGLILEGDDYRNTVVSNINRGSIVKIPALFKTNDFEINEIIRGDIKVNGKDEITFVIDKPTLPLLTTDSDIVSFFEQELFIQSFENANYLFGYSKPVHVFIQDESMYITIQSEFNNFDNEGKYVPSVKPLIRFNSYNRISGAETSINEEDNKYYTTLEIDLVTPQILSDNDKIRFVEKFFIKENIDVLLDGRYKSSIIIPDYLQMFTTTFNKSQNEVTATFNSSIQNMYISNVIGDNVTDFSNITVNLGTVNSGLFAHDLMVFNSYITTPSTRPNDWLRNNIFLSGKTDRTWKSGVWLNLDETGFSKGDSQFGDTNISNLFEGENTKIIDIFFEGEEYLWIELENIIFNTDVYRYITLRGFTGNKSQLIGSTRSNAFRILEVENNLIKIKNPFLEYQGIKEEDFHTNFDKDRLLVQKQEMLLKGLNGINVKACNSDSKSFNNPDFELALDTTETSSTWYQKTGQDPNFPSWSVNSSGGNKRIVASSSGARYKIIAQDYKFTKGNTYTITFDYTTDFNPTASSMRMDFYLNPDYSNPNPFKTILKAEIISTNEISFTFTADDDYETFGFDASLSFFSIYINSMNIVAIENDKVQEFDYGYASVSCFNGGNFYGDFNTIWNAGDFRNGTFLSDGKWFGSDENYSFNGRVPVTSEKTDNKYKITVSLDIDYVQEGDYIRLDYASIFTEQELKELFGGVYGVVESDTSGSKSLVYESNDLISDGFYNVNIIKHRTDYNNNNHLLVDYNSNLYNNSSVNDQLNIFDNNIGTAGAVAINKVGAFDGTSGIPTIDLVNTALTDGNNSSQFTIDMWFNYDSSATRQPLVAFHDSNSKLQGIKVYVLNDELRIAYLNSQTGTTDKLLNGTFNIGNWNHLVLAYDGSSTIGNIKTSINGGGIITETIEILASHDVNYIGRMIDVDITNNINIHTFKGKIDELRVWNVDMFDYKGDDLFNPVNPALTLRDKKLKNTYIPEITAYYDFDSEIDTKNYFPEEEDFFFLNGANTHTLKENDIDFSYRGESLFYEIDYFADKSDLSNGEYKLLTIEEIRDVSDGTFSDSSTTKHYLEVILKENILDKFKYDIVLREKVTVTNNLNSDDLDSVNETVLSADFDIKFFEKTNLIISDKKVYINGELIGEYTLLNRNVFKYTTNTKVYLGKYEFAKQFNAPIIPETFGLIGHVSNVNMWTNAKSIDEYLIYRIISGENTETYNSGTDFLANNLELVSGDSSNIIIPTFNNDGSQIWEHYIYASENDYTQSLQEGNISIEELDSQYRYTDSKLNTALPADTWLDGTDFVGINTDNSIINNSSSFVNNNNYILTRANLVDSIIRISGMENFKFFNKNVAIDGTAFMNVGASGYLFFEDLIAGITPKYPVSEYSDVEGDEFYNQTSTTDAIQFNTIIDIREAVLSTFNGGINNIEYADRDDEFVIKFFGAPSDMNETNSGRYYYSNTGDITTTRFSYFAIRIDKINSNILLYTRRLGESNDQKYAGLRRSDGFWSRINDTNANRLSYYKSPNTNDFVIGLEASSGNVASYDNTEYSLFIPRFDIADIDDGFVDYIVNKDYDSLNDNYGLELFKQFKGDSDINLKIEVDGSLSLSDWYVNSTSGSFEIVDVTTIDFTNPVYDKNAQYLRTQIESNVSRVSFFHNGTFNGSVWHNGIFVDGNANASNLIWKYGIKHNGTFEGNDDLRDYAHWLGGFHTTDTNDLSFMRNLVWNRGQFNGGTWEKGHWLALDLDNVYEKNGVRNDDWSLFNSGEWYSRLDEAEDIIFTNLFEDGDNGTFETGNDATSWGLTEGSNFKLSQDSIISTDIDDNFACGINTITPISFTSIGTFTSPVNVFTSSRILVNRNTEYEITAKVYIDSSTLKDIGLKFGVVSNTDISNVYNVGYRYSTALSEAFLDIKEGNGGQYTLTEDSDLWVDIKHKFNTLENDSIEISLNAYEIGSALNSYSAYINNIEMIGEKLDRTSSDPYKVENHDSVWHGGIWTSPNVVKELDENDQPVFYDFTYQNDTFNLYRVKNNQVLDLPRVNSIFLGGLWLRGEFNGGIFANGFWNSVDCADASTSGFIYENRIGSYYDETYSTFKQGQMINSVWEGGTVDAEGDKLDTIFGELTQSSEIIVNKDNDYDFKWDNDFEFKVSTANVYSSEIFGRTEFIGYHNDPSFDGTDTTNLEIENKRVRRQFNTDGVMSVYWKRGKFNNGMFQFSHFDSLDLNQVRQTIISEELADNESVFNGMVYSSKWKNGLFIAEATDDEYPLMDTTEEEPNSLFYYSNWEKGYWKSDGLETTGGSPTITSPLDTTDDISITNALFSRSIWSAGVFEGGIFDLSIWRSGVEEATDIKYKTTQTSLEVGDPNNLAYYVSNKAVDGTNFDFGASGNIIPQMANDLSFINNYENNNFRFVGSVDNLASIWVNGTMRGSVWHGGIWQRGMFRDFEFSNTSQLDFFGNTQNDGYQLGIWLRGIWMSGYFSYYDDKVISKGADLNLNSHLYNDYTLGNTITNGNEGRRCLFFSINAVNLTDPSNFLGMNDDSFNTYINDAKNNDSDVNNYASIYSRTLIKNTITSPNIKSYWNIFNGSFINGVIYAPLNSNLFLTDDNKMVFSLFSTLSDTYLDSSIDNFASVLGDNTGIFNKNIKTSSSIISTTIPYRAGSDTLPTLMYNTGTTTWENISDFNYINNGIPSRNSSPSFEDLNIWRHNTDEATSGTAQLFGDGTITTDLPELLDSDDNINQVSIAQGSGIKWISDESEGEPKFDSNIGGDSINYVNVILDFNSGGFSGTNFAV